MIIQRLHESKNQSEQHFNRYNINDHAYIITLMP
jgi:hypothetical protein